MSFRFVYLHSRRYRQYNIETSEGNYADYFLEVGILEVHPVEKGAFSKVVDSYMFFLSLYVQPNPNNIMIIRGENNLTKLLDVELESPDHCSKGKSPRDDQCGRLCVRRCLVGCKINTLIFQYLFDISKVLITLWLTVKNLCSSGVNKICFTSGSSPQKRIAWWRRLHTYTCKCGREKAEIFFVLT